MERYFAAMQLRQLPKIVDPMAVIGMIVCNDDPIDIGCSRGQELLSQVRSAIHQ